MGKDVPELGVGVLVDAAVGSDAEVAPARDGALELDALDLAAGRLEAVVWILGGDACGHDVAVRVHVGVLQEVDLGGRVLHVLAVEPADLGDVLERDAHADLELRRRQVHPSDLFGDGVLHLQTRVELQEVELVGLGVVEVLHSPSTNVADVLSKPLRSPLHLLELVLGHNDRRALLKDFLKPALGGAVTATQRQDFAVLIAHNLNFDVPGPGAELHHEYGRARHLTLNLRKVLLKLSARGRHADALAAAAFRGFQYHGVADSLGAEGGLCHVGEQGFLEGLCWDGSFSRELGLQPITTPRNRGHPGGLRQDPSRNLVPQHRHHRGGGANEGYSKLLKLRRQGWVLRGMTPTWPNSLHSLRLRDFADEVDVGVVVHILACRDLHERVCEPDVVGVGIQVFPGSHGHEVEGCNTRGQTSFHMRPLPQRNHSFCGCHAVAGDEDPLQRLAATAVGHIVCEGILARPLVALRACHIGSGG
mmetsp:Transcript_76358/g.123473  ORF Transcript_76358/g.123473 Transcript_76358/m.123473 type:complete len:477 (+) Transcript_76358:1893-3323(+)